MNLIRILLGAAGVYLAAGLVFALPFVLVGAGRLDSHAATGSWGFRLLIVPGTVFLWPLLGWRWVRGRTEPPEENSAHRRAAGEGRRAPRNPSSV